MEKGKIGVRIKAAERCVGVSMIKVPPIPYAPTHPAFPCPCWSKFAPTKEF